MRANLLLAYTGYSQLSRCLQWDLVGGLPTYCLPVRGRHWRTFLPPRLSAVLRAMRRSHCHLNLHILNYPRFQFYPLTRVVRPLSLVADISCFHDLWMNSSINEWLIISTYLHECTRKASIREERRRVWSSLLTPEVMTTTTTVPNVKSDTGEQELMGMCASQYTNQRRKSRWRSWPLPVPVPAVPRASTSWRAATARACCTSPGTGSGPSRETLGRTNRCNNFLYLVTQYLNRWCYTGIL